ncbi:uncharacterized protein L201_002743 [Kwoniella dendrophila CBS 6074]|uniref:TPPC8 first Ig-like domain-containing protein n=1 Tax=Kwoniella dendrophila CBS 6074 TaxID=1295534 RepID=A0AAX4JRU6_9TREE
MPSPPLSIIQSLSPRIAVLTSQDVIQSCEANGCRGLEELLRPWEGGTERVSILSTTLSPTIHPTFPVRFVSFESVYINPALSAPTPDVTVDLISSFVGAKKTDEEQHYAITRSLLLSSRPIAAHETFNHPVGILFAVSTATADPLGTLNRLHAQSTSSAIHNIPWMDGNTVLRFYVVVHDVSTMGDDMAPAHELLANVKKAYGPHSTLLVINSQVEQQSAPRSPDISTHPTIPLPRPFTPDESKSNPSALSQVYASALSSLTLSPMTAASESLNEEGISISNQPFSPSKPIRRKLYGTKLTAEDTQRLAALIRELVVQSLVPWMEARIREWNEIYHSNRRGLTGRLFGAGRKFFGSSRPNSPSPATTPTGYNTIKGYYPIIAVEALSRRLADFAFMLRDYKFAGGVYDSLRKDFAQDRAWRYSAGATEMYGLCLLLSHSYFLPSSPPSGLIKPFTNLQHTEITSWLEQSITLYQQNSPYTQIQLDALRITVLYYEAWKAINEFRSISYFLVKGSGEYDEVPSAVIIEEAAQADIKGISNNKKGRRRRAFHLVLAARRYETAGLKTYSRRCLERASQIYRDSPWTSAQDRIEYSLGRQAYTLGESDVAVEHFLRLLRREDTGVPGSQAGPLQDMAQAYEQLAARPELLAESSEKLRLPTPVFDIKKTRIIPTAEASTSGASRAKWVELESQAFSTWDRKGKKPMTLLSHERRIVVGVDETFQVELEATNPLNAPLALKDITIAFDDTAEINVETISEISLDPYETRTISISVVPLSSTTLKLTNVSFLFNRFFPCTQSLIRKGKRLHGTKAQRITPSYAEDSSLTIHVTSSRAGLYVELQGIPDILYKGEEVQGTLRLVNRGKLDISDIGMIWNEYGVIRRKQDDTKHQDTPTSILNIIPSNRINELYNGTISPEEEREISIICSAYRSGPIDLIGLILFSNTQDELTTTSATSVQHHISVRPLMRLSAHIRPTGNEVQEYMVVLEALNRSSRTVKIENIIGISPTWIVQPNAITNTLLPNQTLRTILLVKYDSLNKIDLLQSAMIEALGKLVKGQPPEEVSANLENEIPLVENTLSGEQSESYLISKRFARLDELSKSFPTLSSTKSPFSRLFPLIEPLNLDLQVNYSFISSPLPAESLDISNEKPEETRRKGQLYLNGLKLSPSFSLVEILRKEINLALISGNKSQRTMYEETSRLRQLLMNSILNGILSKEDDPIHVKINIDKSKKGKLINDFNKNGPIRVPVVFEISNLSPILPIKYLLNLPKPSSSSSASSSDDKLLPYPQYVGPLIYKGKLRPTSKEIVKVNIWSNEPCLVNLGGWELFIESSDPVSKEGSEDEEVWSPRNSWSRLGQQQILEVRQA